MAVIEKRYPFLRHAAAGLLALSLPALAAPPPPAAALSLLDAVELLLEHDPNIALVRTQIRTAQGSLRIAAGQFDPVLTDQLTQAATRTPLSPDTRQEQRTTEEDFGLVKQFRTGLSIEPQLQLLRTENPAQNPGSVDVASLSFAFRQPLLRGRGRVVTAALEISAERELQATRLDLTHATAERIVAVADQYWSWKAAVLNLDILRESEGSARTLLETTRQLVAADQTPAAELVQVEANLAAQEVSRLGGETALFKARQDLGREIGLDSAAIAALPLPAEPFPALVPADLPPEEAARGFVAEALSRRADLQAARERLAESEILLRAAHNALLPQLDLLLTPGYNGLTTGGGAGNYFSPLLRNIPGASVSLGVALTWPTLKNKDRGALEQALAGRDANALRVELVAKEIGADVPTAFDGVLRSARQLSRATDAVRLFERTVVNEEKKLRAGTSTLINVITQRDRLTAARQGEVAAQLSLAQALVELRFATGTLLATEGESPAVRRGRLTTIPALREETR